LVHSDQRQMRLDNSLELTVDYSKALKVSD